MKNLRLFFIISAILIFSSSFAQEGQVGQRPAFLDKVFVGGGFGAGFGSYTYINIAPIIGYRVSPRLSVAMRIMYQYTTYDYYVAGDKVNFSGNDYGIGGFARFIVKGPFYLQAEYEHLNYEDIDYQDGSSLRSSFDSFMAGGGIAQPIGGKAFFFLTVMYNFSYNNINRNNTYRVPYNSPMVIRVGITAGF